jgi:hypothetical protein
MEEVWSYEDFDRSEALPVPDGIPRMPEGNRPDKPEQFGVIKIVMSADGDGHCMTVVLPLGITVSVDNRNTAPENVNEIVRLVREVVYFRQLQQEADNLRIEVNLERMRSIERLGIAENLLEHETAFTEFLKQQQEQLGSSISEVESSYREVTEQVVQRLRRLKELGIFHIDSPAGYFDNFTLPLYEKMLQSLSVKQEGKIE